MEPIINFRTVVLNLLWTFLPKHISCNFSTTEKLDLDIDRKTANFNFKNPQNISLHFHFIMNLLWTFVYFIKFLVKILSLCWVPLSIMKVKTMFFSSILNFTLMEPIIISELSFWTCYEIYCQNIFLVIFPSLWNSTSTLIEKPQILTLKNPQNISLHFHFIMNLL